MIDAVGVDRQGNCFCLVIRITPEWDDAHLFALQEKINACLAFIESGELFIAHPDAQHLDLMIEVLFRHPPPPDALAFLRQAADIIGEAGIVFRYGPEAAPAK